jgi:Druantia protein DruA
MPATIGDGLAFCGRPVTDAELGLIRGITREFANLALTELAATICELLQWRRPNGGLKARECYLFLRELHRRGWLPWLPPPRPSNRRAPLAKLTNGPAPAPPLLTGSLDSYRPIQLQLIQDAGQRRLFREYLDRYHYLGYRAPFGAQLRYWVRPANPELPPLACLLFTSAAWRMAPRDSWIAWTDPLRQLNLPRVINNSRFLILPWTRIPNLASHILSQAARQLPADWQARYGVEPVLLETLVDPERYRGTCYRAANWIEVGMTQGRGRMDRSGCAQGIRKQIFLYPLHRHWRKFLCTTPLAELT